MNEITYGYAEVNYVLDCGYQKQIRVSTLIKAGNWIEQFLRELEVFVFNIEVKNPLSLEFQVFAGVFIDNKSDNVINASLRVV